MIPWRFLSNPGVFFSMISWGFRVVLRVFSPDSLKGQE